MQRFDTQIFTLVQYMVKQKYLATYPNINLTLDADDNAVPAKFPCLRMTVTSDASFADNLENTEQGCSLDFTWDCYMTGGNSQNICKEILAYITDLLRGKGFIVRMKPIKAASTDLNVIRYTTRFHRVICGSL